MDEQKLIHDINSSLWAISNGIVFLCEKTSDNKEQSEKILKLTAEKIDQLMQTWEELKRKLPQQEQN